MVFSIMNIIKPKIRNKMQPQMLKLILTMKSVLKRHGKCQGYKLTDSDKKKKKN